MNNQDSISSSVDDLPLSSQNKIDKVFDLTSNSLFPSLPTSKQSTQSQSEPDTWIKRITPPTNQNLNNNQTSLNSCLRFEIPLNLQSRNRDRLGTKTSISDLIRQTKITTKTSIDVSTSQKTGTMTFIINGSSQNIKLAKRLVQNTLGLHVTQTVSVPVQVRPFIVGSGGKNLKALTLKTLAKVSLPRIDLESKDNPIDPDAECIVTVSGDYEGVQMACTELEAIVATKTSKRTVRLQVERSYHPFINLELGNLQIDPETRIILAPWDPVEDNNSILRNLNEIAITGSKSGVQHAQEVIQGLHQKLQYSTRTLSIPVAKKQHRFIVGIKGCGITDIMNVTGCYVEVPIQNDPSDVINIRGPSEYLGSALNAVMQRSSSIQALDIDVGQLIPPSMDLFKFLVFFYSKEKQSMKLIETETGASIIIGKSNNPIIDIQSKTKVITSLAHSQLTALIKSKVELVFIASFEIPKHYLKYVIGKEGQGLLKLKAQPEWNGRLIEVMCPNENDEAQEITLVVNKIQTHHPQKADEEAKVLTETIKSAIIENCQVIMDISSRVIVVEFSVIGKLIGQGGSNLKELLAPYEGNVTSRFSSYKSDIDEPAELIIRGPSKDVEKCFKAITLFISNLKQSELLNSFSKSLDVSKGMGKRLVSGGDFGGQGISWLMKFLKELEFNPKDQDKILDTDLESYNLNLKITNDESGLKYDTLKLTGPIQVVHQAIKILQNRAVVLKDIITQEFNVFQQLSEEALIVLRGSSNQDALKLLAFRRIVGKEKRKIKKISDDFEVQIQMKFDDNSRGQEAKELLQEIFIIKGLEARVDTAKNQILTMANYEILHSFSDSIIIDQSFIARILGKGGLRLTALKDNADVRIDINEIVDDISSVRIVFEGTSMDVVRMKRKIEEEVDDLKSTITSILEIPSYLHKKMLGPAGSTILNFVQTYGGPEKLKIKFTKQNSIIVSTNVKQMNAVEVGLHKIVNSIISPFTELPNGYTEISFSISKSDIPSIVGRKWEALALTMQTHGVAIFIDEELSGQETQVHILAGKGYEENLKAAQFELMSKIKASIKVQLPLVFTRMMTSTTQIDIMSQYLKDFTRSIRSRFSVQIDFDSFHATIKGDQGVIQSASEDLATLFTKKLSLDKSFMHIIELPKNSKQHIIGKGGSTINLLKGESDLIIQIYNSVGTDFVFIHGSESDSDFLIKTKEMVQSIIKTQIEISGREVLKKFEEGNAQKKVVSRKLSNEVDPKATLSRQSRSVPGWSKPNAQSLIPQTQYLEIPKSVLLPPLITLANRWTNQSKKNRNVPDDDQSNLETQSTLKGTAITKRSIEKHVFSALEPKDEQVIQVIENDSPILSKTMKKKMRQKSAQSHEAIIPSDSNSILPNEVLTQPNVEEIVNLPCNNPSMVHLPDESQVPQEWTSVGSSVKKFKQNQSHALTKTQSFNDSELELKSIALGLSCEPSQKKKKKKNKKSSVQNLSLENLIVE